MPARKSRVPPSGKSPTRSWSIGTAPKTAASSKTPTSRPQSRSTTPRSSPSPPAQRDLSQSAPPRTSASHPVTKSSSSAAFNSSGGHLRAPTELGQFEQSGGTTPSSSMNNNSALRHVRAHPNILLTRQLAKTAVQRQCTPAALQEEREIYKVLAGKNDKGTSFCKSFTYQGMEVMVVTTSIECYLVCARTQLVFQSLNPTVNDDDAGKNERNASKEEDRSNLIISLRAHPTTGQIVLVTANGRLSTFSPKPSDPRKVNFGRFHWWNGPTADCARIFDAQPQGQLFAPARRKNGLEVSLSEEYKILLAHKDQLTVLDTDPSLSNAEMLWTTCLPSPIVTAQLSGDAHCIAVVLEPSPDDQDAADADGVHTLERDWEGDDVAASGSQESGQGGNISAEMEQQKGMADRRTSVGILYKPGPFLVHSAPVTRLSFRGHGKETSHPPPTGADESQEAIPGNDLLLTVASDSTAQIFGQSNWKPLTEWTMSPKTRVDWITGAAAVTLGDLEGRSASSSQRKKSGTSSGASSRRPSGDSDLADLERAEALNETLAHRHSHFTSIPTHTTPVSKAGAWICEICCEGSYPSLRLSRLTYLKRGADDLSPTLFESVSGYLPPNAVYAQSLLGPAEDAATLTVEGLWPIWNPFVGETNPPPNDNAAVNETLRGSAMAFLGLSSAHHPVGAGGAFFGDPQLIGTQCPPTELRLTMAHPVRGHVTVLEYPLYGDNSLTSLELGRPTHSVLALDEVKFAENRSRVLDIDSVDHGGGRLIAKLEHSSIVSVTWRQPGSFCLLPHSWHADDVSSPNVTDLLSNTKRLRDESLLPAPIALRPLRPPREVKDLADQFAMTLWWPDSGITGAPPILLAFTKEGRAVAFAVVTPLVAATAETSATVLPPSEGSQEFGGIFPSRDEENDDQSPPEYEVSIVPDPELGLGLRLESLDDGQPAIAGSFKKNPATGGILPAEKTGLITIGDELMSANGIALEDKTFDEIIATVRELGASSGPGHPMRLRFRRQTGAMRASSHSGTSDGSSRRTMEHMFGLNVQKNLVQNGSYDSGISHQAIAVAAELQNSVEKESNVVAFFQTPISSLATSLARGRDFHKRVHLLPHPAAGRDGIAKAVLCCAQEQNLAFTLLAVPRDATKEDPECKTIQPFPVGESDIAVIHFLERRQSAYFFLALEKSGHTRLAVVELDLESMSKHSVKCFDMSTISTSALSAVELRAHSVELFATLDNESTDSLAIWTSKPQPGLDISELESEDQNQKNLNQSDYFQSVIRRDSGLSNGSSSTEVVDFGFVASGYLDANPLFAVFDKQGATLFHRPGGTDEWLPLSTICYATLPASVGVGLAPDCLHRPLDSFPHLIASIRTSLSSTDEISFLRADWHPEALLANLCLSGNGADFALKHRIRDLFLWLCSEGSDIQEDQADSPLLCAPLETLEKPNEPEEGKTSQNVLGALISGGGDSKGQDDESKLLRKLQNILAETTKRRSRHEKLQSSVSSSSSTQIELPPMLRSSSAMDLSLLWGIGELLLNPPDFQSIDTSGQLFVFATSLFGVLHKTIESNKEEKAEKFVVPTVLRRESSNRVGQNDSVTEPQVSSSACLAALTCDSQERILEWAKRYYSKMDWEFARRMRVPFWLRTDTSLARLSEEIGQTIYREKRDVMECAIFFIIARKFRTLRNLAATDQSDSGKKFFTFITNHDFSSERGRRAAEKNAFSLLRKCRYRVASAFFLLAEPPSLQSALETIVTKLQDYDLAFMVARLMESKELAPVSGPNFGSGFGGVLGGGGGYAGAGMVPENVVGSDKQTFGEWTPSLGKTTKKLLVERAFQLSTSDNAMGTIQLLWMKKPEEAAWWLPGFLVASPSSTGGFRLAEDAEGCLSKKLCVGENSKIGPIERANAILDFTSIPFLLKQMRASARPRDAGCLRVSSQLASRGIEVPSLWAALSYIDEGIDKDGISQPNGKTYPLKQERTPDSAGQQSSIFDNFDVPAAQKRTPISTSVGPSIFDSYNVPSSSPKPQPPAEQPSIFDSFDVPTHAVSKAPAPAPASGMQSSIFDDFDIPGAAKKPSPGEMQSSIFDSYDTPKPTATPSIFDSFDVPGQTKKIPTAESTPNEQNKESIDDTPDPDISLTVLSKPVPEIWSVWKDHLVLWSTARRLLREVASILASFHGDPPGVSLEEFFLQTHPILPSGASEVLQVPCDASGILEKVRESLEDLATASEIDEVEAVEAAVSMLGGSSLHYRVAFMVVLYASLERYDLAESRLRSAAAFLIDCCKTFAFGFDDTSERGQTRFHASSIQVRRIAARISWQLETCLWLHRSGGVPLSGFTFKEVTVAVRLGVLLASWTRTPDAVEALLRCEPDSLVDEGEGMQLWSSLKASAPDPGDKNKRTSSGGWEFFVDCRRSEATKILRESPTGSFIIRPHPNDTGVFTLSFKTNLVPGDGEESGVLGDEEKDAETNMEDGADPETQGRQQKIASKPVKKDDIVQHAIIRLSDSGFRCGSFGPFTSLLDLLESVSESLPFELRFDLPPSNRVIREEGSQPSPNAVLFRKLALTHASSMVSHAPQEETFSPPSDNHLHMRVTKTELSDKHRCYGAFLDLLVLTKLRRQLSGVAIVQYEDCFESTEAQEEPGSSAMYTVASWILAPLLSWCRSLEVRSVVEMAPSVAFLWKMLAGQPKAMTDVSEQSIEITLGPHPGSSVTDSGDSILRSMIQRDSGVEFSTLRLVDGGECSMVVLFSKNEAVEWLTSSGTEQSESDAIHRLERMERERVIEPIDFSTLPLKQRPADLEEGVRYRFVDPWEVEAVSTREGETRSASIGRQHFLGFSLGKIALACESDFRMLGGIPLLELWMSAKGGVVLSRALAAVHPPWERAAGGDLQVRGGVVSEPEPFANSIRQHLYRNALFQRLELPQRFLALVQVELLDLKNLTSPGGALSLSVYALLRLKRRGSSGVLSNKTRTLDTAATSPVRLGKPTGVGPNAPASWGSVVRFRYPLPDEVSIDGTSFDMDREALFKGPPSVLQITVYEKKLLVDHALGTADVEMDSLLAGGQVEEWVPLRSEKQGINWFTRIRLTLRFELMCLASRELKELASAAPSVGLQRIETLCQTGGAAAHEDHKRSISSPDLLQYLESMVY